MATKFGGGFLYALLLSGFVVLAACKPGLQDYQDQSHPSVEKKAAKSPDDSPSTEFDSIQDDIPELISLGVRQQEPPAYIVPEMVRSRLFESHPQLFPEQSEKFKVYNQRLKIDAINSSVTFAGVLRTSGKEDEAIELTCKFNKSQTPWTCADMLPTNVKVAEEKRLQGTFKCLDTYRCDRVGVAIWASIDGKLQPPQIFQTEGFKIRRARSGDADELAPLKKAAPKLPSQPKPQQEKIPPKVEPTPTVPRQEQTPLPDKVAEPSPPVTFTPSREPTPTPDKPRVTEPSPAKPTAPSIPEVKTPSPTPVKEPEKAARNGDGGSAGDSDEDDNITDPQELDRALNNPNAAVEIIEPMRLPSPAVVSNSATGVDQLRPEIGSSVPNQAIGSHNSGSLHRAAQMAASGKGFVSRDHNIKDFGTNLTIDLLTQAFAQVHKLFPGKPAFLIGAIANRIGGALRTLAGNKHSSHQTGLDIDIGFPQSTRGSNQLQPACQTVREARRVVRGGSGARRPDEVETHCRRGVRIAEEFDERRFWEFIKQITCADQAPVIAMFLDAEIKNHMCQYVAGTRENIASPKSCGFRALQALKHEGGHHDHVHVRLRCPGNRDCQNALVTLANSTGC